MLTNTLGHFALSSLSGRRSPYPREIDIAVRVRVRR